MQRHLPTVYSAERHFYHNPTYASASYVNVSVNSAHASASYINVPDNLAHASTSYINIPGNLAHASASSVNLPGYLTHASASSVNVPGNLAHASSSSVNVPGNQAHASSVNVPGNLAHTYASASYVNVPEESDVNHQQDLDRLSYRQFIRNSIRVPEMNVPQRRRKRNRCKLLRKDHSDERLFIAYILLVTSFTMTFCCTGIAILIRMVPLRFFPDCWKLAVGLACVTCLLGAYICWEDGFCRPSQPQEERIQIEVELETFAENR